MKNRIMIPAIFLLSFMLSSFQDKVKVIPQEKNKSADQMFCGAIVSLIHNGEELAKNYDRHTFCFHPDGLLEACNDLFCEQGRWEADNDVMNISINAAFLNTNKESSSVYEFLNGTWKIIERSEGVIELEKIDKDYWRVKFSSVIR